MDKEYHETFGRIKQFAFVAIAVACLAYSSEHLNHYMQMSRHMDRVVTPVVSMEIRYTRVNRDEVQKWYHPIVRFFDQRSGQWNTVILSEGSQVQSFGEGEEVTLLYPPSKPNEARIRRWTDGYVTSLGLALLGLLSALAIIMESRRLRAFRQLCEDKRNDEGTV